ncbi:MAG: hypothetical protein LRY67_05830 [Gammaproteobacteria bacterium]|nr:hypothetical protein [Gammaproteobacteria bacterium]MCD8543150.1 hypothetical protein [Gammaproteobacteria bacterium]
MIQNKGDRRCVICNRIKPYQDFLVDPTSLSATNICLACSRSFAGNVSSDQEGSHGDGSGGGGKQYTHTRDSAHLQHEIERDKHLQKTREESLITRQEKGLFQRSHEQYDAFLDEEKQREFIEKEEKKAEERPEDEPNITLSLDSKERRENFVRRFSITQKSVANRMSGNQAMFSRLKSHLPKNQIVKQASTSGLFSSHKTESSSKSNMENLLNAIHEGQKLFKR